MTRIASVLIAFMVGTAPAGEGLLCLAWCHLTMPAADHAACTDTAERDIVVADGATTCRPFAPATFVVREDTRPHPPLLATGHGGPIARLRTMTGEDGRIGIPLADPPPAAAAHLVLRI